MKIWLPAIRAGSGADVYTERLAAGLQAAGIDAGITWFAHRHEIFSGALSRATPPSGTDVIHANSWSAHALLGRGLPVVTVVHHLVHDPAYAAYRSTAQALYHRAFVLPRERRGCLGSAAVVTPTRYVAGTVQRAFGVAATSIPNWVDESVFTPAAPAPARDRVRLLWVGNASRRKGADWLPWLAARLGPRFEIRCTGGLRGAPSHGAGLVSLGVLSSAALVDEYHACDLVLSTSRYEGFGYTALEAMACARPFVGFAADALREVVDDGRTGLLAAVDDGETLARHCERVADDRELARALGEAGLQRARSAFAREASVAACVALYRRVIAG